MAHPGDLCPSAATTSPSRSTSRWPRRFAPRLRADFPGAHRHETKASVRAHYLEQGLYRTPENLAAAACGEVARRIVPVQMRQAASAMLIGVADAVIVIQIEI